MKNFRQRGNGESRASGRSSHLRLVCASSRIRAVDPESMAWQGKFLVLSKHESKSNVDEEVREIYI